MRFRQGRKSRRDILLSNKAALEFAAAAGDKTYEFKTPIPDPPRRRASREPANDSRPLERDVLAAVLHALRLDKRVFFAERQQSGVFQEGNRYIRVGATGHLDIKGMLRGGQYFEMEAKRPGMKPTERQVERIQFIQRGGGIAGWFTSVEEALALLP